jgi:succinate dehydrogenase / fumarate reductase, membrane anchor subunit
MDAFNKQGIGPGRKVTGAGYGMRDWLMQRITAVIMVVFTVVLVVASFVGNATGYFWWAGLMSNPIIQALTMVTFIALAWHAWVGMRDIWMDYVKPAGLRLTLHVLTIVWLLGCLTYAIRALWRL